MDVKYCNGGRTQVVVSDYRRKVGQLLVEVGLSLEMDHVLDFRLVLRTEDYERVIDQD